MERRQQVVDSDLDYEELSSRQRGVQQLTCEIEKTSGSVGLLMNAEKCKIMVSNDWEESVCEVGKYF